MKKELPTTSIDFGKIQPNAIEIEEAVLSACLTHKDALDFINLNPSDFYRIDNSKIFEAILSLRRSNNPIDMLTVCEQLKKMGEFENIGGAFKIADLQSKVSGYNNVEYHSKIVKQKADARRLIEFSSTLQSMAFDDATDLADLFEFCEKEFTEITSGASGEKTQSMVEALHSTIDLIKLRQENRYNGNIGVIDTGLTGLNHSLNGGWSAPDLIILGGRPSMGKTQLAIKFAENSKDCLFISLEMKTHQIITRLITKEPALDYYNIKTGQLSCDDWQLIDSKLSELSALSIEFADGINIEYLHNIKSLARKKHREGKLKIMIIDYLQLIRTGLKFGTRDLEIGHITRELKSLAKELDIPIILLSQLNRPEKGVKVRKPNLTDLRESGNIEQDADVVLFIHRPTYYDSEAIDANGNTWAGRGEIVIAKQREGERDVSAIFHHDEKFKNIFEPKAERNYENPF